MIRGIPQGATEQWFLQSCEEMKNAPKGAFLLGTWRNGGSHIMPWEPCDY